MPKSHPKLHKRSLLKGKHGGLAAKAPIEEPKPAAKIVKEQKSLSRFVREVFSLLFLRLWELGQWLFSFGPREKEKEPSLSLERADAASPSSALCTPSGVSVPANHASEEHTEGPAVEKLPVGENFASIGLPVKDYLEIISLEHLTEDDKIESERPGSDSGYWKKEHNSQKKELDDLKKKREDFDTRVILRQAFSDLQGRKEFVTMDNELTEEVRKLLNPEAGKQKNFKMIVGKTKYTKMLRTMFIQQLSMDQQKSFCDIDWRKHYLFPKFDDNGVDYKWWEKNYDPEILMKRLAIMQKAAENRDPEQDIFNVIYLVTKLNFTLHPHISKKDRVDIFRLASTMCSGEKWSEALFLAFIDS